MSSRRRLVLPPLRIQQGLATSVLPTIIAAGFVECPDCDGEAVDLNLRSYGKLHPEFRILLTRPGSAKGAPMQSVLGIFDSRAAAEQAVQGLLAAPVAPPSIIFLSGEAGKAQVGNLTTTDTERDGMGEVVGGVVGGAVGTGIGLALGSAIASLFVPGVGTVFAIGLGAAAVLGLGGAAAGAAAGEASEEAADVGVPKDDTLIYRELLKRGRSLVIANVDDDRLASMAKAVFHRLGAQDVEEARKKLELAA